MSEQVTMDQLLETHREQQKQLTSKIIALRKSVPKSDKRKKREVNSRIADLEYDLKTKQEEEIRVLKAVEAGLDPNEEQVREQEKKKGGGEGRYLTHKSNRLTTESRSIV